MGSATSVAGRYKRAHLSAVRFEGMAVYDRRYGPLASKTTLETRTNGSTRPESSPSSNRSREAIERDPDGRSPPDSDEYAPTLENDSGALSETGQGAFRALRADEFLGTERGRVDKCWPLHSPADWGRHAPDYGNGKYEESLTTPIRADIDASLVAQL